MYYRNLSLRDMITVSLKISEQLDRRIRAAAKARRVSVSRLIRDLLEQGLPESDSTRGSAHDRMFDGIGVFSSGVPDLGTNPRHLDGLGE